MCAELPNCVERYKLPIDAVSVFYRHASRRDAEQRQLGAQQDGAN